MFKRGGGVSSRNNGIVSGFDDGGRVGYTPGGAVDYLKNLGLFEQPAEPKGLTRSDFLRIAAAGAQIMGAPASGQTGLRGALTAAGPVLGNLGTDLASSFDSRRTNYQNQLDANRKLMAGAALSDYESKRDFDNEKDILALKQAGDLNLFNLQDDSETKRLQMKIAGDLEIAKLDEKDFQAINKLIQEKSQIILGDDSTDVEIQEAKNAIGAATAKYISPIISKMGEIEIMGIAGDAERIAIGEGLEKETVEFDERVREITEALILQRGFSGIGMDLGYLEIGTYAEGGRVGMNMGGAMTRFLRGLGTDSQEQSEAELNRIAREKEMSQKQDALLRMIDRQRAKRITNSNRVIEEIEKMGSVLSPSDKEFIMERNNAYNTFEGIIREDLGVMGRNPDGPRVGFFNEGGLTSADRADVREQSAAMQSQPALTFEELRARLPNEVTDAVVRLLASSEAALLDFAGIESEQDIAIFNQKYNSDLQLPTQVA